MQNKVKSIGKSYKKENNASITLENGQIRFRQLWPQKDGSISITFDNFDYNFNWDVDGRTAVNIKVTKQHENRKGILKDIPLPKEVAPEVKPAIIESEELKHEKFNQIKLCVQNKIPVYLVGPAGSGKNHTLEQIADELGLDFYFTNSIQQEFKLTGFIDAGGKYHETEFYKAFVNGGLFFLDEMDASIPEVLVLLNAAIANGYFEFPNGKVDAHKKFRVVATGNTMGNGADEQYVGRLTLDQATLDRFAIISFDYSIRVEMKLAKGNTELVDFVRALREQARAKGIRATFSYRCISMLVKLEGKMDLHEILAIAVFKGMDKDTLNNFNIYKDDKYSKALKELKVLGA